MNQIDVRTATIADGALIADLSRQTFFDTFAAANSKADMDKFMNEQFNRTQLMAEVADTRNEFLLACLEQQALGYVKIKKEAPRAEFLGQPASEICRIYAVQDAIGKGVGRVLMQHSIERAMQWHKKIIWLGVWEKNLHAISFYRKWGFEKFGEHDFLLGNDVQRDWLMKKTLP